MKVPESVKPYLPGMSEKEMLLACSMVYTQAIIDSLIDSGILVGPRDSIKENGEKVLELLAEAKFKPSHDMIKLCMVLICGGCREGQA